MKKILSFCKKSILLYTIAYTIFFTLFKLLCNYMFGIEYRNWVYLVAVACIGIGGMVGAIQMLCWIPQKPIKITLIILLFIGLIYIFPVIVLFGAFAYVPEHHIEKDGKNYLASVRAFLQVNVDYYKDYGFCFRGYELEFSENYGKGGYDPFTREDKPDPISTTNKKGTATKIPQQPIEEKKESETKSVQEAADDTIAYLWEDGNTKKKVCLEDYAMGNEAIQIFQTDDGGETWTPLMETGNQTLWVHYHSKFLFVNSQIGFIYDPGRDGAPDSKASVLQTVDGGRTFQKIALPQEKVEIYFDGLPYQKDGRLLLDTHYYQRKEKKTRTYQSINNGRTWTRKN